MNIQKSGMMAFFLGWLLCACGEAKRSPGPTPESGAIRAKPLLIFHGGRFSCKQAGGGLADETPFNVRLLQEYQLRMGNYAHLETADYLITCFSFEKNEVTLGTSFKPQEEASYSLDQLAPVMQALVAPVGP